MCIENNNKVTKLDHENWIDNPSYKDATRHQIKQEIVMCISSEKIR